MARLPGGGRSRLAQRRTAFCALIRGAGRSDVAARAMQETDAMALNDLPSQVVLMLAGALQELQRSEAETDLARIRNLITNVQSILIELCEIAERARDESG